MGDTVGGRLLVRLRISGLGVAAARKAKPQIVSSWRSACEGARRGVRRYPESFESPAPTGPLSTRAVPRASLQSK